MPKFDSKNALKEIVTESGLEPTVILAMSLVEMRRQNRLLARMLRRLEAPKEAAASLARVPTRAPARDVQRDATDVAAEFLCVTYPEDKKNHVIKAIREIFGLGLADAKGFVEGTFPIRVTEKTFTHVFSRLDEEAPEVERWVIWLSKTGNESAPFGARRDEGVGIANGLGKFAARIAK